MPYRAMISTRGGAQSFPYVTPCSLKLEAFSLWDSYLSDVSNHTHMMEMNHRRMQLSVPTMESIPACTASRSHFTLPSCSSWCQCRLS